MVALCEPEGGRLGPLVVVIPDPADHAAFGEHYDRLLADLRGLGARAVVLVPDEDPSGDPWSGDLAATVWLGQSLGERCMATLAAVVGRRLAGCRGDGKARRAAVVDSDGSLIRAVALAQGGT
jgi:hypothetical protein